MNSRRLSPWLVALFIAAATQACSYEEEESFDFASESGDAPIGTGYWEASSLFDMCRYWGWRAPREKRECAPRRDSQPVVPPPPSPVGKQTWEDSLEHIRDLPAAPEPDDQMPQQAADPKDASEPSEATASERIGKGAWEDNYLSPY